MQPLSSARAPHLSRPTIIAGAVFLAIVIFIAGWLPTELERRRFARSLEVAELELRLADLHRQLGRAALEAQQNNFASAGVAALRFFDGCRTLSTAEGLAAEPRTRTALSAYAGYRNDVMAQIAAGDPAVKERLTSLYMTMDGVLRRRE